MSEYQLPYFEVICAQNTAPGPIPYGVKMIGAELEWPDTKGKGIKVAVVDTGIATHPDLKITGRFDATGTGHDDKNGHGTHCAGTIAANGAIKGVAPEAELYAVKVFGATGGTNPTWLVSALRWCRENKMDVISMSLGGPRELGVAFETEMNRCIQEGIVIAASAGNFGRDYGVLYPAKYKPILAVAAIDITKRAAEWSAYGNELDMAAAGVEVYSTYPENRYALLSGTSMACPHIAGACALIQAKALKRFGKKLTPAEVRLILNIYADDAGAPGFDERYGHGIFSFGRFGASETITPPPVPAPKERKVELVIDQKTYHVNGVPKETDVAPFIKDARTFTPARVMAEGLGAKVDWDEKLRKVTATLTL